MKYFSYKLGTIIYKKKGRVIVHGLHGTKKLHQLLKDFCHKFVLCPKCEKRTALSANEAVDTLQKRCRTCDYEGHLYTTDKMSRFIWRNKRVKPPSERMRTTLPKSKETSYAAKFKSTRKNALVAKSTEPIVKVTKQNKNTLSAVGEIPVNKQMGKRTPESTETNYEDKLKSRKKNTLVVNPNDPEVKAGKQKNILSVVHENSMSKQMGKNIPKSKGTNCVDKLRPKKNTVVVKSTAPAVNAPKPKKNRRPVVCDIPRQHMYTDVQDDDFFPSNHTDSKDYEHCIIEFKESAALPTVENAEVNNAARGIRTLSPKILITRIPKYVNEEDIIENIKDKNPWLRYLIKNEDDFKKVATLNADTNGRPQYVIKCSPQIRRNVAARGDKLYILDKFGDEKFCKVYDRYHVVRCTKCQKFGHKLNQCRGELVCPKCGRRHWLRDCNSETSTCLLCQGPHITGNRSCQKYKEQEARIKDRTDHGEHLEVIMPDLKSERAERKNRTTKQQKTIKQEAQRKEKEKKYTGKFGEKQETEKSTKQNYN
ncbi:uncharacterized protein [Macrobrachium rosenbergii]